MEISPSRSTRDGSSTYQTKLRPILEGCGQESFYETSYSSGTDNVVTVLLIQETDPVTLLRQLVTIGINDAYAPEDDEKRKLHFQSMAARKLKGRIRVGWSWESNTLKRLSNNYGLYCGRLRSVWARLQKDPELLQKYHETFLEQERNGDWADIGRPPANGVLYPSPA
ncbi:unnamed protein product [Toxocara canis]|uniref:ALOG domain-containing protein n=1 Tax=Toxocara canis TaxID=6265 RepID=A0A183UEJ7_TOXCA|nr:unnamed protein product [Toxocara canis]